MSIRFLVKVAALASTCWLSIGAALAENRIALVIGNSSYTSVTALPNPANDAKAMAKFLGSAGFQVLEAPNLTQSEMRKTISNFASMAAEKGPDTVALVFYAGHGVQVDGENFLIPIDAQIEREADVPLQAMRLADLMNALSSIPSKSTLVILDACRNNPFSAINKTSGRGLAIVDAPNGSLVSYSTAPGFEAMDDSPYLKALLQIAQEPGLPIEQALKRVRQAVAKATDPKQVPWESSSLTAEFSFFPTGTSSAAANPRTTGNSRSQTRSVEAWQKELKSKSAREAYETVVSEDKVEAYQAYLALYPSQSTAPTVRTLLDRRQVMIAWYEAVTINTVASYQAFLAGYGNSDFAATADRLVERARTRSFANAASAFASATCPCSQPSNPTLRQQKRTDSTPTQNGPGTSVAILDPTPVTIYTPPVVTPVISIHPRPHHHNDKPGRPSGNDKPKPTGGSTNVDPRTRGTISGGTNSVNTVKMVKSTSVLSTGRGVTPMVQRQSYGQTGMGRNMSGGGGGGGMGMSRMSFGRR